MNAAVSGAIYTCPMHPEVESPTPGACLKCGMALELKTRVANRFKWTCPMHPEIVRFASDRREGAPVQLAGRLGRA